MNTEKNSGFKGVRLVTAKTGWREGNINRCKTWTPLSPLCLEKIETLKEDLEIT